MGGMKSSGGRRNSAGGRRKTGGGRRKAGTQQQPPGSARASAQPGAPPDSSRIHLTHILRGNAIWHVFVATRAGSGADATVHLEFERAGGDDESDRYSSLLTGPLRDALYGGGAVSRADLLHELELAIQSEAARREAPDAVSSGE
jgi:hypothetical protein